MKLEPHALLNAIAEPTRLRIVHLLKHQGELCVCDLVIALDTHQPKISRHLAVLRDHGLITGRREGTWIHYRLNPELPTWASNTLTHLIDGCSAPPYSSDLKRLIEAHGRSRCG